MNRATTGIKALKEVLADFGQEGSISEFEVGQRLGEYWHKFDGSRYEGMMPWKLARLETHLGPLGWKQLQSNTFTPGVED